MAEKTVPAVTEYEEHHKTYEGFLLASKAAIVGLVLAMVGLYCLAIASQPVLGALLIIASIPIALLFGFYSKANT